MHDAPFTEHRNAGVCKDAFCEGCQERVRDGEFGKRRRRGGEGEGGGGGGGGEPQLPEL